MKLNYKASNIANAEDLTNKSFLGVISELGSLSIASTDMSKVKISSLIFLLEAGGATREEASDIVDDEGIETALDLVFNALQTSGFLAKMQAKEAEKAKKAVKSTEPSEISGKTTKN
nr:MAG TPA: tail assembly chaperone protein [Caudoviricetes sp.]